MPRPTAIPREPIHASDPDPNPSPRPMSPHLSRLVELIAADPRPDAEIARAAGMAATQFSQLKRGERPTPSVDTVWRILEALGQDWSALNLPNRRGRTRDPG